MSQALGVQYHQYYQYSSCAWSLLLYSLIDSSNIHIISSRTKSSFTIASILMPECIRLESYLTKASFSRRLSIIRHGIPVDQPAPRCFRILPLMGALSFLLLKQISPKSQLCRVVFHFDIHRIMFIFESGILRRGCSTSRSQISSDRDSACVSSASAPVARFDVRRRGVLPV